MRNLTRHVTTTFDNARVKLPSNKMLFFSLGFRHQSVCQFFPHAFPFTDCRSDRRWPPSGGHFLHTTTLFPPKKEEEKKNRVPTKGSEKGGYWRRRVTSAKRRVGGDRERGGGGKSVCVSSAMKKLENIQRGEFAKA